MCSLCKPNVIQRRVISEPKVGSWVPKIHLQRKAPPAQTAEKVYSGFRNVKKHTRGSAAGGVAWQQDAPWKEGKPAESM